MDTSLINEYKEKYRVKYSDNFPEVLFMVDTVDGGLVLIEEHNFLIKKERWEMIKKIMDDVYEAITDEEIEKSNEEAKLYLENEVFELIQTKEKPEKEGYVYFLKADNGLIKIGQTKELNKRLDHFTTKLPYALKLIHHIKTADRHDLERHFQNIFEHKRKRGEWFELNDEDIEFVKK